MTDSNYTHILAIVDRSGSMAWGMAHVEMANALNEFFKEQANVEGKCLVDYVQFDNVYEKVFSDTPVVEAKAVIKPRGGTALVDAIGQGTKELGDKLAEMKEVHRPGKVLVVVVTDGAENSSHKFTANAVKKLITKQQDEYDWDYVFLGANIDAVSTGALYGFKADKSMTFDIYNHENVGATSVSLSNYATTYRGGGNAKFNDADRKKAVGK